MHPTRLTVPSGLAAAVSLLVIGPPLAGEDWPAWRGARATGVADEAQLPTEWSDESLAWSVALGGAGVSSPIVSDGRIFVTSQQGRGALKPGRHPLLAREDPEVAAGEQALTDENGGADAVTFVIEAFDREAGDRQWQYRLAAGGPLPEVHEKHNLASPSPVTDGERVYAWFGTGQLVALTVTGELVWQRHLGAEIAPFQIDWGHGSSPALHDGLLFLICYHDQTSHLIAVAAESGETRWQIERDPGVRSYSTPIVVATGAGDELIVNSTEGIHAYDPRDGTLLWSAGSEHRFGIGVPSFHAGVLYASRGYRSGPYMAIRPGGRGDVSDTHVVWRVATGAPYLSSLIHYDGLLYMGNDHGIVTAIDAASGEKSWQERTGAIFSASPVAGDGKIYFMSESGETLVYAAGPKAHVLARNQIGGRIVASPAIAAGQIFIRTDDRLIAIGETGAAPES